MLLGWLMSCAFMNHWIKKSNLLNLFKTLPFILLGLTPLLWFFGKGDVLINGIDTNFPLNPSTWLERRFYVWNNVTNAGVDFSSSVAGLFFHLIQFIPYKLGFSLQFVEIFSLTFWFLLLTFSSYYLAKTIFPKKIVVHFFFVSFYVFNIYLFNTWENVKVANLALMASIPLAIAILVKLQKKSINYGNLTLLAATTGIILTGSGINPAYFLVLILVVGIFYLSLLIAPATNLFINQPYKKCVSTFLKLLFLGLIIICINMFWILPTTHFIFGNIAGDKSIDKIGFTNWIDSLSENTGVLNIMRLQGAWDWYSVDQTTNLPLYIPYALNYFHNIIFVLFSFLIPGIAIVSLLFRGKIWKNNYLSVAFGIMFVLGVFLGAGTHLPTGSAYRWVSERLPFFTLFRSPWYIFTPLTVLGIAGLSGLLFSKVLNGLENGKLAIAKWLTTFFILAVSLGNLVYSYPLVTGKIFRPGRSDGFYINFPAYIFDAGKWLQQGHGRVIGYPDDEIENFHWKYRGIESILQLVSNREVLFSPLNAPDSPQSKLVHEFYTSLKRRELNSMEKIGAKLDISLLFYKADQDSIALKLPEEVKNFSSQSFGKWIFYKMPTQANPQKIYAASDIFLGDFKKGASLIGALDERDILLEENDSEVKKIPRIEENFGNVIIGKNSWADEYYYFANYPSTLSNRLQFRDISKVEFEIDAPKSGKYTPMLETYRLEDFGLDVSKGIEVLIDGKKYLWNKTRMDDSYVYFEPIELIQGLTTVTIPLVESNLVNNGNKTLSNFISNGLGDYKVLGDESEAYLSIINKRAESRDDRDISALFKVEKFDPLSIYLVQFKYKQVYGNNGLAIAGQNIGNTLVKIQQERLPNYPEWNPFSFYYEPVKTESEMKIELVSPFIQDPLGTKILYSDLGIYKVFTNRLILIRQPSVLTTSLPNLSFNQINPTEYEAKIDNAEFPHTIVFSESYSPDWKISVFADGGNPVSIKPLHFSANLYANAWYFDKTPSSYNIKIYYWPQKLFIIGASISIMTIIFSIALFLLGRRKRNEIH